MKMLAWNLKCKMVHVLLKKYSGAGEGVIEHIPYIVHMDRYFLSK